MGLTEENSNISEHEKSGEMLSQSEEQFRRAIEDAPIPIIVHAEDGQIIQVSRSLTELTGYTISDVRTFDEWLTKTVCGEGADSVRKHLHALFKGSESQIDVEFPIRTIKGEVRYWSFSASSPGRLQDGRRFIIGMAVDISDRKKVEDSLRKQANLLDLSPTALFVKKFDGTITFWSKGSEKLYGYTSQEALGQVSQVLLKAIFPKPLNQINETIKREGQWSGEVIQTTKFGQHLIALSHWTLENPAKRDSEVLVSSIDISERKKTERALRERTEQLLCTQSKLEENAIVIEEYANRMEELANERAERLKDAERLAAIGQTAGMVGHDIRNPLQAISGNVYLVKCELEALRDGKVKECIVESLEEIEENLAYIDKIVWDLQDYARPIVPEIKKLSLDAVVGEVLQNKVLPSIKTQINVEDEARLIAADHYMLTRILENLVINAVQAMPNGGTLGIRAYRDSPTIVICVQDTGNGIRLVLKARRARELFSFCVCPRRATEC
jgi:PAS domain S-box-containing protein